MCAQTIIISNDLIHSVRNELATLRNRQKNYSGIVLWSENITINGIIQNQRFRNQLSVDLTNNNLNSFAQNVHYSAQEPANDQDKIKLNTSHGNLCIGMMRLFPHIIAKRGSLKASEYILDWTRQRQWNIGRGEQPADYYGANINNYIVIKNDEKDKDTRENNERVSSFHAKILYEDEQFYLQCEKGGRDYTRIKQDGEEDTTVRTGIKIPLSDGAFIRLGSVNHYVLLLFELR